MPTKSVMDRQKSGAFVAEAARTHSDRVVGGVQELFATHLRPGETMPDVALLFALTERALGASIADVVQADEAHERETADDQGVRTRRDETSGRLYTTLAELRELAVLLFGKDAAARFGLAGPTPREPIALSRRAADVSVALGGDVPAPKVMGATFEPGPWRTRLDEERRALDAALADVTREQREAEGKLTRRDEAIARHDERFSRVATFLSGALRLAGDAELARRVRPSTRRPGQVEGDAEGADADVTPVLGKIPPSP
jgi:hypothetical protein